MRQQNHLFWRAGFGPTPDMLFQSSKFEAGKYFKAMMLASEKKPEPLVVSKNLVDGLLNGLGELNRANKIGEEEKKKLRQERQKQSRQEIRNLNLLWLNEMVESPAQLREKLAFFWHGHFACRNLNSYFQQQLLSIIRDNALGNFGDLLRQVSKSPAMIQFLNNQQNRKQHPNENFAREVMELFTLGRGHYTEDDIKEAARAFTGWSVDINGEFIFRRNQHDGAAKTVFGKSGHFDGDDIIDLLLAQKQTAIYITQKIYRFFVNDTPDAERVNWLAHRFYNNDYSIGSLLKDIFTASWFYEETNMGNRIKSPVELLVGLRRQLPMTLENEEIQLLFQKLLGQILFLPPNVAGWPGGKNWIDGSALLFRMRIPQIIANAEPFQMRAKTDDDMDMGRMMNSNMMGEKIPNRFRIKANVNWQAAINVFDKTNRDTLFETLCGSFLQTGDFPGKATVEKFANSQSRASYISSVMINLMSCPEYQLC